jgi:putative hydrolase of the HAD superfamily
VRAILREALSGIRAIVLDIDDTIVDTREAMVAAGTAAVAALWPHRPDEHRAMAERYYDDPQRWFRRYAAGELVFDDMRRARLGEVATWFGVGLPDGAFGAFEDAYSPAFRNAQRLFPDVPPLLERASSLGLPVALLTNSAAAPTQVKLEALELAHRFETVVTTDTLGFGKPDPRTYLEACRLLGVDRSDVVCIGDSLEWDVLGARAAGLRAVWLDRAGTGTEHDVPRVTGLDEVAAALDEPIWG